MNDVICILFHWLSLNAWLKKKPDIYTSNLIENEEFWRQTLKSYTQTHYFINEWRKPKKRRKYLPWTINSDLIFPNR